MQGGRNMMARGILVFYLVLVVGGLIYMTIIGLAT